MRKSTLPKALKSLGESVESLKELEQPSPMKDYNLHYFNVTIVKQQKIENYIEYVVQLKFLKTEQQWYVRKRFRDFNRLNDQLK